MSVPLTSSFPAHPERVVDLTSTSRSETEANTNSGVLTLHPHTVNNSVDSESLSSAQQNEIENRSSQKFKHNTIVPFPSAQPTNPPSSTNTMDSNQAVFTSSKRSSLDKLQESPRHQSYKLVQSQRDTEHHNPIAHEKVSNPTKELHTHLDDDDANSKFTLSGGGKLSDISSLNLEFNVFDGPLLPIMQKASWAHLFIVLLWLIISTFLAIYGGTMQDLQTAIRWYSWVPYLVLPLACYDIKLLKNASALRAKHAKADPSASTRLVPRPGYPSPFTLPEDWKVSSRLRAQTIVFALISLVCIIIAFFITMDALHYSFNIITQAIYVYIIWFNFVIFDRVLFVAYNLVKNIEFDDWDRELAMLKRNADEGGQLNTASSSSSSSANNHNNILSNAAPRTSSFYAHVATTPVQRKPASSLTHTNTNEQTAAESTHVIMSPLHSPTARRPQNQQAHETITINVAPSTKASTTTTTAAVVAATSSSSTTSHYDLYHVQYVKITCKMIAQYQVSILKQTSTFINITFALLLFCTGFTIMGIVGNEGLVALAKLGFFGVLSLVVVYLSYQIVSVNEIISHFQRDAFYVLCGEGYEIFGLVRFIELGDVYFSVFGLAINKKVLVGYIVGIIATAIGSFSGQLMTICKSGFF